MSLSSRIHRKAEQLGFSGIGITSVRLLPGKEYFQNWLKARMHGEMKYLQRQSLKRQDPRLILTAARSILVLATNYYSGEAVFDDPLKGRISRYAWGDDYHYIVKNRLTKLLEFIRTEEPAAQGHCYVDTGPVMEKTWGAQTALGWMGKHTNLITRDYGGWLFLGLILLNTELEYDLKGGDFCGSCNRCISACPTGAIVAPYRLDARLCISYLTIELRGLIPRSLRPLIGNRIFGCDECQEVCPWNRFAATTSDKEFYCRESNFMPDLMSLVHITPEEFDERFKNSPIRRIKHDGFVRNVLVALGNSRQRRAEPALADALQNDSPSVRAHAAWALGQIGTARARSILESRKSGETHPTVLDEINYALDI